MFFVVFKLINGYGEKRHKFYAIENTKKGNKTRVLGKN